MFAFSRRFVRAETANRVLNILATGPSVAGRMPSQLARDAPEVAFKTGTSYGFRDAWSLGVSNGYAIGVWVGRPDGAPRPGADGRDAALPILFEAFDLLARLATTRMRLSGAKGARRRRSPILNPMAATTSPFSFRPATPKCWCSIMGRPRAGSRFRRAADVRRSLGMRKANV